MQAEGERRRLQQECEEMGEELDLQLDFQLEVLRAESNRLMSILQSQQRGQWLPFQITPPLSPLVLMAIRQEPYHCGGSCW